MNTDRRPSHPSVDEAEWLLQEQARRGSIGTGTDAARVAAYRAIDSALRSPPACELPADFAASMAGRVRRQAARFDDRFERSLMRALVAGFGISGGVALAGYAGDLVRLFASAASGAAGESLGWLLAAAACLAVSWGTEQVIRRGAKRAAHR